MLQTLTRFPFLLSQVYKMTFCWQCFDTFDERAVFDLIGVDIDDIADKARLVKESRTVAQNMADRATRGMAEAEQYDLAENMFENMQDPSIVGDDQLEDLFRLFSDD